MPRVEARHYSEEEILMHLLGEEVPEAGADIASHLEVCGECEAVSREYAGVLSRIRTWGLEDYPAEVWRDDLAKLLERFRGDQTWLARKGGMQILLEGFRFVWNYALENPLPALGYVVVALAFASERSFTVFGLDRIIPATTEVIQILRQFF